MRMLGIFLLVPIVSFSQSAYFFNASVLGDSSFAISTSSFSKPDTSISKRLVRDTMICIVDSCYWDSTFKLDTTIYPHTANWFEISLLVQYSLFDASNRTFSISIDSAFDGTFSSLALYELQIDTSYGETMSSSGYNRKLRAVVRGYYFDGGLSRYNVMYIKLTGRVTTNISDTITTNIYIGGNSLMSIINTKSNVKYYRHPSNRSIDRQSESNSFFHGQEQMLMLNGRLANTGNGYLPSGVFILGRGEESGINIKSTHSIYQFKKAQHR